MKISQSDKLIISTTVKELEKTSSGEIVPMITQKSSKYLFFRFMYACLFSYIFLAVYFYYLKNTFVFSFNPDILGVLFGIIVFYISFFLFGLSFFLKLLVPRKVKNYKCKKQAFLEFFSNGVHRTKEGTGILIYISLMEREVVVLGDHGINSKIEKGDWDNLINIIIKSIKEKNLVQGIVDGLLSTNELSLSLHADRMVSAYARKSLERLCTYITRPAISEERLSWTSDGNISYKLKKAYSDGTSHVLFSPLELMEKLSALVPKPRANLIRYHGVLAPNSRIRSSIVPKSKKLKTKNKSKECNLSYGGRLSFSKLLKRVFNIDVEKCESCGGRLELISVVRERSIIRKILNHVGIGPDPPKISGSRINENELYFG